MNNNGDSFVMHIVGYQFPGQTVKQDHDSNWLMIRISARIGGNTWTRVEPALLTWEVESLINWLRQIAGNREVDNKLEFIEPNLSFCLQRRMDNVDVIRVSFDLEFLPDDHFDENDCSGEFQLNKQNIETAASELETELARFGPR